MDVLTLAFIFGGGLLAGIINTVAGGGSVITLPLLIFAGLPAPVANATNRVAIVFQNVGALAGFRRHGLRVGRSAWLLLIPSTLGAYVGVRLALDIDETLMERVIGVVLLLLLVPILRQVPHRRDSGPVAPPARAGLWPAYFLIGVYGGFLQAGVGLMYLALLVGFLGMDLVRANVVKVFFILVYSTVALALFTLERKVEIVPGLVLAAGTTWGGWLGARFAVERGERWIRVVLVTVVLFSAAKLIGAGRLISGLLP